jgi:5,6,7,8-tetrahydromethanopterin hydro-lyase
MAYADPTLIGEAYAGSGGNAAHINSVLGRKGGPLETAWITALATPRPGHIPFVVALRQSLVVKPLTLFVNKAETRGEAHSHLTWGPAHAGVARGVAEAVADGVIPREEVDDLLLIAAVWVDWAADDADTVYANNLTAMMAALESAASGKPVLDDILAVRHSPTNPFFTPSG